MLIKVKVFPGSKKEEVVKKADDGFEVKVRALPVRGGATWETIVALARYFKLPGSAIRLVKDAKQRNKIFEIIC